MLSLTNRGRQNRSSRSKVPFAISYDGVIVGEYVADLIVQDSVLVELKVVRTIDDAHVAQCLNYLAATFLQIEPVLNFSRGIDIKRLIESSRL